MQGKIYYDNLTVNIAVRLGGFMNNFPTLKELYRQKAQIITQIKNFPDFRSGSLVGRYRKCGKPNCHCAKPDSKGHGPSWSLTRTFKGKTITKIIPKDAVEITRKQISQYHQFQETVHNLVETNVKICNAHLESSGQETDDLHEVEKKG